MAFVIFCHGMWARGSREFRGDGGGNGWNSCPGWRKPGWREAGFSLMEALASLGIGMLVMGIGTYTYWAISRQDRSHVAVEREVARLRDDLVKAHLQAQRGTASGVKFYAYNLVVVPEERNLSGLSYVSFVPPEGYLSLDCLPFGPGASGGLQFRVGRNETWYAFTVGRDGTLHAERSTRPANAPLDPVPVEPDPRDPVVSPPDGSPPPGGPVVPPPGRW